MKKIVLLDVDDVLADFKSPILASLNRLAQREKYTRKSFPTWDLFNKLTEQECIHAYRQIKQEGFCERLCVMPGAQDAVGLMRTLGADVHFVTSPWVSSRFWHYERHHWLKKHFDADHDHIHQSAGKHLFDGDVFVDDKVQNVVAWHTEQRRKSRNGVGVVWDNEHNQLDAAPGPRTNDWTHLIREIIFPPRLGCNGDLTHVCGPGCD